MGGFLAMFAHIYLLFGRGDWLAPQRLSSVLGNALIFAHLLAAVVIVARDLMPSRSYLWRSLILVTASLLAMLMWYAHIFLFLYQTTIDHRVMAFAGFSMALGFWLVRWLDMTQRLVRALLAMTITAIMIYLPIYITYQAYLDDPSAQALLYFATDNRYDVFLIGVPFALTIAVLSQIPLLFAPVIALNENTLNGN
ncbi:MAG: hypothetical protein ACFE0Q_14690 [Anaerolineae bacterium]